MTKVGPTPTKTTPPSRPGTNRFIGRIVWERIDLSFATQDINDLIKSMTLRDVDGGQITAVSYDSNVPVERTLQSFAVNLTGNPSFSAILNQARGEKVEVTLQQANATQPGTLTGSIVGVEQKKIAVGKDVVDV